MEKMFETAIRNKMRFPFKGMISVEDLWDLNVRDLDSIFKTLNAGIKRSQEESLLSTKTDEDKNLLIHIEIVKYIVDVKLKEQAEAIKAKEISDRRQKLMELISAKQDEELHNKSVAELTAMLDAVE